MAHYMAAMVSERDEYPSYFNLVNVNVLFQRKSVALKTSSNKDFYEIILKVLAKDLIKDGSL